MRIGNLTGLDSTRHLVEIGRGRACNRHIIVPGEETKTGAPFEVILQARTSQFLDIYLSTYRNRVCQGASPYLFPNPQGGLRCTTSFARSICGFVERETGLKIHVHLFRQIAGKLYLAAHPEGVETVRQLLQHKKSDTTMRYYTEQRIADALSRYDDALATHREPSLRSSRRAASRAQGAR